MIHNKILIFVIILLLIPLFPIRRSLCGTFPSSKIPAIAVKLSFVLGLSKRAINGPTPNKPSPPKILVPAITAWLVIAVGRNPPPRVPGWGPAKLKGAEPKD